MSEEKGFFQGLLDFSFRSYVTPKILRLLYALHLLFGLIVAVGVVVSEFHASVPEGLLALILAVVALFFWFVYCRVIVEVLGVLFRTGEAIAPSSNAQPQQ